MIHYYKTSVQLVYFIGHKACCITVHMYDVINIYTYVYLSLVVDVFNRPENVVLLFAGCSCQIMKLQSRSNIMANTIVFPNTNQYI